ncbi:hypothetical protein [Pontibacillus salipaludis]|uniref:Uncharacterized protein n=1 Tax=Pontibacillus salipaludis TaxID=1697394 RepID=A0ABQ1QKY6_9BACI|nr:hypothetical protein [Pontibacillus salipaludis]GGD29668.1 hypothetical protein GCM10011389_41530 [Pontibacillus salipaludis]
MITVKNCIRQGHSKKRHYFVFVVEEIARNIEIHYVLNYIKDVIMPQVQEGYSYESCTYSNRYDGWLIQVSKHMDKDMG